MYKVQRRYNLYHLLSLPPTEDIEWTNLEPEKGLSQQS